MGNTLSTAQRLDYELHQIGVTFDQLIGNGRLLKSLRCFSDRGYVVVKCYIKTEDSPDLEEYIEKYSDLRNLVQRHNSISLPIHISEHRNLAYLVRPYFYSNLYDRFSVPPVLGELEKAWLSFQLLRVLYALHNTLIDGKALAHGDIKAENCLLTSWDYLVLSDVAIHKPSHINAANSTFYSFFFDSSGRRSCLLAPERLLDDPHSTVLYETVTPEMDIFAAACTIVQLYLDGIVPFDYSAANKYKRNQELPSWSGQLSDQVSSLIVPMLSVDPESRPTAATLLQHPLFPLEFGDFLFDFVDEMLSLEPSMRVGVVFHMIPHIRSSLCFCKESAERGVISMHQLFAAAVRRTTRVGCAHCYSCSDPQESLLDEPPAHESASEGKPCPQRGHCCCKLILRTILSQVTGSAFLTVWTGATEIVQVLASCLSPADICLEIAPYILSMLQSDSAVELDGGVVISASLAALSALMYEIRASEYVVAEGEISSLFPHQHQELRVLVFFDTVLIPTMRALSQNRLPAIRSGVARCLIELVPAMDCVLRMVVSINDGSMIARRFEMESKLLSLLSEWLSEEDHAATLTELLRCIHSVWSFISADLISTQIVPHLVTVVGSTDVQVRLALFDLLRDIVAGSSSTIRSYLLPVLFQGLLDVEPFVVSTVLDALTRFLSSERAVDIVSKTFPFLLHPNPFVRASAHQLYSVIDAHVSQAMVFALILPILRPILKHDILSIDSKSLELALIPPFTSSVYDQILELHVADLDQHIDSHPFPFYEHIDYLLEGQNEVLNACLPFFREMLMHREQISIATIPDPSVQDTILVEYYSLVHDVPPREVQPDVALDSADELSTTIDQSSMQDWNALIGSPASLKGFQVGSPSLKSPSASLVHRAQSIEDVNSHAFLCVPILQLMAHQGAVLGMEYLRGANRLITAGSDRNVGIWDVSRFEQNISATPIDRVQYGDTANHVVSLGSNRAHSVVAQVGRENVELLDMLTMVSVHTHSARLDHSDDRISVLTQAPMNKDSCVMIATVSGRLSIIDTRMDTRRTVAWEFQCPKQFGGITAVCHETSSSPGTLGLPVYTGVGTSRGHLMMIDMRYNLPVSIHQHSSHMPIRLLTPYTGRHSFPDAQDHSLAISTNAGSLEIWNLAEMSLSFMFNSQLGGPGAMCDDPEFVPVSRHQRFSHLWVDSTMCIDHLSNLEDRIRNGSLAPFSTSFRHTRGSDRFVMTDSRGVLSVLDLSRPLESILVSPHGRRDAAIKVFGDGSRVLARMTEPVRDDVVGIVDKLPYRSSAMLSVATCPGNFDFPLIVTGAYDGVVRVWR